MFTFPTGDAGFYRPIGISAPTNAAHHFTAQYFRAAQAFGTSSTFDPTFWTVSACDYWTLDRTNGTSNVNVTLSWNENACGGAGYITNLPDLRVARWNGAAWVSHGNGGTTGSTTAGTVVTGAAVTSFSPFALASTTPLNPLPIELEYFRATPVDNIVSIEWKTQAELDNDFFTVERSSSGFDFEAIGTIKGNGTSAAAHVYHFADEQPYYGRSYYRLKQTDFDGTSQYYGIATVFIEGGNAPFTVYPNPAGKEKVYLSQKANIVILNHLNQVVKQGNEITEMNVSDLSAGVYLVRNHKGEIARLVIQ
ncbi:MAG: T9SS type A sorting domain-containing protein [Bacteroidia bacterium]|nr:T9SS type A sorting domain-containing protein [Bacteroidia bacterium]